MKPRDRLRIAMQKSGRLTEPALDLLKRCGPTFRQSRDKLFCFGEGEPVDLLLVRDDDIPGLIAQGVCDVGIVGRNVLGEFQLTAGRDGEPLAELRSLGFGRCRLSIAVPQELDYASSGDLAGRRIATSYPGLLGEWLRARDIDAAVVTLAGSVEIAPKLGTADAICDPKTGRALLSWRVAVLPFIEQEPLYKQFKLDEPWDSPHNARLLEKMPRDFVIRDASAPPGHTYYQVFTGPGTLFDPGEP